MKSFMVGLAVLGLFLLPLFLLPKGVALLYSGALAGWQIGTWAHKIGVWFVKYYWR